GDAARGEPGAVGGGDAIVLGQDRGFERDRLGPGGRGQPDRAMRVGIVVVMMMIVVVTMPVHMLPIAAAPARRAHQATATGWMRRARPLTTSPSIAPHPAQVATSASSSPSRPQA